MFTQWCRTQENNDPYYQLLRFYLAAKARDAAEIENAHLARATRSRSRLSLPVAVCRWAGRLRIFRASRQGLSAMSGRHS
jgi:hypothetical protein